ncbi:MAG: phosphatase PAP2 family protein [Firmicutes bacterium]|nr:phosphatase PAP2 family protein [Bacillota bacterium]
MNTKGKLTLAAGAGLLVAFVLWTLLITTADLQPAGPEGSMVGLASFNLRFHRLTGVHMSLYTITDWLGLVPVAVCLFFGGLGLWQLIKRRSLLATDLDIVLLGIYYVFVILAYLIFEMYPVNYRPVLIDGRLEASYPSSTTLLVLSVMPTLIFQAGRRLKKFTAGIIAIGSAFFTAFMVIGRLISGVHWLTDIIGALLLSMGLFYTYKAAVMLLKDKETRCGI